MECGNHSGRTMNLWDDKFDQHCEMVDFMMEEESIVMKKGDYFNERVEHCDWTVVHCKGALVPCDGSVGICDGAVRHWD